MESAKNNSPCKGSQHTKPKRATMPSVQPVHSGALWVLRTLIRQKVDHHYSFPANSQQKIDDAIESYCVTCIDAQGEKNAVCDTNVDTFLSAIEQVFGSDMDKKCQVSSLHSTYSTSASSIMSEEENLPQNIELQINSPQDSMSSINTSDTPVTVSKKKVKSWQKKMTIQEPMKLPPGVLWRKTKIKPSNVEARGLEIIHEHVMEDHIRALETALDLHEVELVNEMRSMKGEAPISYNSAVVVNNCVYVTGGPAIFRCIMETYESEASVSIFVHVNSTTSKYRDKDSHQHKTFVVECSTTGSCIMRYPVTGMRFWKELGTATICMLPSDSCCKRHMAPTTYFHLESVSHCRLFAKELTRK